MFVFNLLLGSEHNSVEDPIVGLLLLFRGGENRKLEGLNVREKSPNVADAH